MLQAHPRARALLAAMLLSHDAGSRLLATLFNPCHTPTPPGGCRALQPPSARPASSATSSVCASAQTKGLHIPSTCASHLHYNGAAGPPTACQQPETVTIPASASPRTPLAQLAPRVRPACPTAHRRPDGAENERAIAHRAAEPAEACSRHDHAKRRQPTATMQSPPRRSHVGHLLVAEPCRANAKPALHREDRPLRAPPQDCHRVILPCQTVPIVVQNPPRVAPISDCVNHPHTLCSPCMRTRTVAGTFRSASFPIAGARHDRIGAPSIRQRRPRLLKLHSFQYCQ